MSDEQLEAPTADVPPDEAGESEPTAQAEPDDEPTAEAEPAAQPAAKAERDPEPAESGSEDAEAEAEAPAAEAEVEAPAAEAEVEAPAAETEAEAPAPAESDDDSGEAPSVAPEVQEYIGDDTTVVHATGSGGPVKSPFRTPPGIPGGLDPGTPDDRDR